VEADHALAFAHVALRVRKQALVVLFTQVYDSATSELLQRRIRGISRRHLPLIVMFRDADVDRLMEGGGGGGVELYVRGAAAETLRWREGMVRELKRAGGHVLEVTPGELTARLVNQYLQIKARQLL
jgi:uncharacterized protein (DUF58 family)